MKQNSVITLIMNEMLHTAVKARIIPRATASEEPLTCINTIILICDWSRAGHVMLLLDGNGKHSGLWRMF